MAVQLQGGNALVGHGLAAKTLRLLSALLGQSHPARTDPNRSCDSLNSSRTVACCFAVKPSGLLNSSLRSAQNSMKG